MVEAPFCSMPIGVPGLHFFLSWAAVASPAGRRTRQLCRNRPDYGTVSDHAETPQVSKPSAKAGSRCRPACQLRLAVVAEYSKSSLRPVLDAAGGIVVCQ